MATPIAVLIVPSMPLAPRLACTVTSARGVAYHSRSRTGIDDATTRWAPARQRGEDVAGRAGLGRLRVVGEHGGDGRLGRLVEGEPPVGPSGVGFEGGEVDAADGA